MNLIGNTWTGSGAVERKVISVENGRITDVAPFSAQTAPENALAYPESALIVPGLHDAHLHLLEGGLRLDELSFRGISSTSDALELLRDFALKRAPQKSEWLCANSLDESVLQLTRTELDRVVSDTPLFIWSHDWHSAFVNSAALIAARIDGNVKHPERGRFERDAAGKLNGVLREQAAYVVRAAIPEPTSERAQEVFLRAQALALSHGFTALSCSVRRDLWPHYLEFSRTSARKLRINFWRVTDSYDLEQDRFEKIETETFRMAAFKGFADGALGSRTAALWQPYVDQPDNTGLGLIREGPLARFVRAAHQERFQLAMHAIGDRANSICLDAFEMAGSAGIGPALRPRIEHCQILRERDIARFAELGVIASMQPIHCTADMKFVEPRIGAERAKFAYAWKSLLDAGATLAFGSDWPVESMSPLAGIHAAVTREDASGQPAGGWQREQCISIEAALRAYTAGAAYAANWERNIGTIEAGKLADITVLDRNLFACDPREILQTKILATIINGEVVYSS